MPHIENIVKEIYDILLSPASLDKKDVDALAKEISYTLLHKIEERKKRLENEPSFTLRVSNYGLHPRKLWHDARYPEMRDEGIKGSDLLKFLIGDITECVILYLAEKAGYEVEHRQTEIEFEGIPGHPDAVINGVLVDVKSASSYAFRNKFKTGKIFKGDDSFGYIPQLSAYSKALGAKNSAFLVWDKESGELLYLPVPYRSKEDPKAIADAAKAAVAAPEPPEEKCYEPEPRGKSGNMVLAKPCKWCPHKFNCWKDANDGEGLIAHEYTQEVEYFVSIKKHPKSKED